MDAAKFARRQAARKHQGGVKFLPKANTVKAQRMRQANEPTINDYYEDIDS